MTLCHPAPLLEKVSMIYGRATPVVVGAALLALGARTAAAQGSIIISGRVVSDAGVPIGDASVDLRTLGLGGLTRQDGRYTVSIPSGRQAGGTTVAVTVRRVGFRTVTRQVPLPASGPVTLDFALVTNPLQLGEVVVTGAGTTSTAERLATIRKVVDSSLIRRSNENNLVTALAGKAPGVIVQQQSGEAGGGARIQIRGVRSVQGTGQPLFIVDGVPINNSTIITNGNVSSTSAPNRAADINPNDIESLEILSGPAAAAVYGSLAGNGVVLITTKKGRAGRTTYALRSSYSNDRAISTLPFQQRFGVGTGSASPACVTGGPANCFLSAGFFSWGAPIAAGTQTFNQVSEIFEPGYQLDNTLNVSGGNERTTFFLSGGANNQNGYYVTGNDKFNRYTGRLNASHRAADQLVLGGNVLYARTGMNAFGRGNNTNGMMLPALRTPPNFDNRNYLTEGGCTARSGSRTRPLGRSGATAGSTTRST
jgi:TonB-dependent SusC/RagA subfamily outer membrane receptor